MIDEKRVKARKHARDEAQGAFDMIHLIDGTPPWPDGYGADWAEAFLEKLAELLPKRRVSEPEPEKPIPIARLGGKVMVFGQHNGKCFDDIPLDYLDWVCAKSEDFVKEVRAYLTHPDLESRRQA
jgi:hypothetical protein